MPPRPISSSSSYEGATLPEGPAAGGAVPFGARWIVGSVSPPTEEDAPAPRLARAAPPPEPVGACAPVPEGTPAEVIVRDVESALPGGGVGRGPAIVWAEVSAACMSGRAGAAAAARGSGPASVFAIASAAPPGSVVAV